MKSHGRFSILAGGSTFHHASIAQEPEQRDSEEFQAKSTSDDDSEDSEDSDWKRLPAAYDVDVVRIDPRQSWRWEDRSKRAKTRLTRVQIGLHSFGFYC